MVPLFEPPLISKKTMSEKSSPAPLHRALVQLFQGGPEDLWLVGGTALAGYYAEHRRSDDIDLFAGSPFTYQATVMNTRSLKKAGALFQRETSSPAYYRAELRFEGHPFTIDIVLDENLHHFGQATKTDDGIWVATPETLLATKIACLVSRCSEKDLFDLSWLLPRAPHLTMKQFIELGNLVDGGLNIESLLISMQGARLREEACHFLLPGDLTPKQAFHQIEVLRKGLIQKLMRHEAEQPLSADVKLLKKALKEQKKLR